MLGEFDKQMMLKFLDRNYPVSRVKHQHRFKRGIILDDGSSWLLGEPNQLIPLQYKLSIILVTVFGCDIETSKAVLNNFLRLT